MVCVVLSHNVISNKKNDVKNEWRNNNSRFYIYLTLILIKYIYVKTTLFFF